MKINKQIGNRGFTLVELMIVIVIIGVLAALASFGFIEYVKKSKSAEADEFVKKIGDGAKVYFEREQRYGGDENTWHTASQTDGQPTSAGMPVPGNLKTFPGGSSQDLIWTSTTLPQGGGKVIPDYSSDNAKAAVFKLLNYTSTDPTYFTYGYSASGAGGTGSSSAKACIIAEANFDSDSTGVVTDCTADQTGHANQTLVKKLSIKNGDVFSAPPVLNNQGK